MGCLSSKIQPSKTQVILPHNDGECGDHHSNNTPDSGDGTALANEADVSLSPPEREQPTLLLRAPRTRIPDLAPPTMSVSSSPEDARNDMLNHEQAAAALEAKVEQGSTDAMFQLGCLAYDSTPKNVALAVQWWSRAAEQSHAASQNGLGWCHFHGHQPLGKDVSRAAHLFEQASDQGNARACNNLGICHQFGLGVELDLGWALAMYHRAIELGYEEAQEHSELLIQLVFSGDVHPVFQDPLLRSRALLKKLSTERGVGATKLRPKWFEPMPLLKSAEECETEFVHYFPHFLQGDADSTFRLGKIYESFYFKSTELEPRLKKKQRNVRIFQLMVLAAELGHLEALCEVGCCLYYSTGTVRDSELALSFFTAAARHGSFKAMKAIRHVDRTHQTFRQIRDEKHFWDKAVGTYLTGIDCSPSKKAEAMEAWANNAGAELEPPLRSGAIALLDARWLVQFAAREDAVLPYRQQLPPEAFLSCDQVIMSHSFRSIHVMALSYMWLHPVHPDPKGTTLKLVAKKCQEALNDSLSETVDASDGGEMHSDCPRWAVFWDFASLHQHPDPANGVYRTPQEQKLFGEGLDALAVLFSHPYTRCIKVTKFPLKYPRGYNLPDGANCAEYNKRGWPLVESCLAGLKNSPRNTEDLCLEEGLADFEHTKPTQAPLTPEQVWNKLQKASFTNDKADRQLVMDLYRTLFVKHFGKLKELNYSFVSWGDEQVIGLAKVIGAGYTPKVETIDLTFNEFGLDGCKALAKALSDSSRAPQQLSDIRLGTSGDDGATTSPLDDACVQVLANVLIRTELVSIESACLGTGACRALADAAERAPEGTVRLRQLYLSYNHGVGTIEGFSHLCRLVQHCPEFIHLDLQNCSMIVVDEVHEMMKKHNVDPRWVAFAGDPTKQ